MKTFKKFWFNTSPEYKDYLFIYLWGIIWGAFFFVQPRVIGTPQEWSEIAGRFWGVIVVLGGIAAVYGLLTKNNLLLERLGVTLLMVGPISYALALFGELIFRLVGGEPDTTSTSWRVLTTMIFAIWPLLFLNKRRRHLRNRVKLVAKIPLEKENGDH